MNNLLSCSAGVLGGTIGTDELSYEVVCGMANYQAYQGILFVIGHRVTLSVSSVVHSIYCPTICF